MSHTSPIPPKPNWPPTPQEVSIRSNPYIDKHAADYHFDLIKKVAERVDLAGKRVLEIGSDYHLISARLFIENGAQCVVATNIGDWKSDEPLPEGVTFKVGDMGTIDLGEGSFDLIYGIAILEHIPNFESVVAACKRCLAPTGLIYLQGCPIWGGSIGHHVWYEPDEGADMRIRFAAGGAKAAKPPMYRFTDPACNPIPNWAHLTHHPNDLAALLTKNGVPREHAAGIVNYVYNQSGEVVGSCSNFKTASEIVSAFRSTFDVAVSSWQFDEPKNEYYIEALKKHSRYDLDTLGVELWLRHPKVREELEASAPKVSVIVPFYGVEEFISDCIESIRSQDYPSLEIILIDDASPDGSRTVAERAAIDDNRVQLITHSENRGLGLSRNTGIEAASGQYLLFLDSDDVLAGPSVIRCLVNAAIETNSEIVTGRAIRLNPNLSTEPFDELFEERCGAEADRFYSGLDAYRATFNLRGSGYLPMRAWGYLITADTIRRSGIDFPAGAHEDIGVVPIICYLANRVHYIPDSIVKYRFRPNGISNSEWSARKSQSFENVWLHFRTMLSKFGLEGEIGFAALMTARQALWKIQSNSVKPEETEAVFESVSRILRDIRDVGVGSALHEGLQHLSDALLEVGVSEDVRMKTLGAVPASTLIRYHRERLSLTKSINSDDGDARKAARDMIVKFPVDKAAAFVTNDAKANKLLEQYRKTTHEAAKNYPSMLTEGDKAVYYDAGLNYRGLGTIVDGGCFVGGTTHHLVQGLKDNPSFKAGDPALEKIIKVYDLFEIDEDYILDHLKRNFPARSFKIGGSFEPLFRELMEADAGYLEVFPGDVMRSGYNFDRPIEILGVDFCKALSVTDYVVRTFFPRVLPGGLIIQQDFIHEFHPHIHLSMLRLDDHFDLDVEMKWGGSVTFRLNKAITEAVINERFGTDESWFKEAHTNVRLLEDLIARTMYDENQWVMILTLGFYYHAIGEQAEAKRLYQRAVRDFPHFEPSEITRVHLDGH